MTLYQCVAVAGVAALLAGTVGCNSLPSTAPSGEAQMLSVASAGYTGCLPDQNAISNIAVTYGGSRTWNATCNG